jgi:hypothetical protein
MRLNVAFQTRRGHDSGRNRGDFGRLPSVDGDRVTLPSESPLRILYGFISPNTEWAVSRMLSQGTAE